MIDTLNFETWIGPRMAEHRRAEGARNAPAAVALDALNIIREALAKMCEGERAEVVAEVRAMLAELIGEGRQYHRCRLCTICQEPSIGNNKVEPHDLGMTIQSMHRYGCPPRED